MRRWFCLVALVALGLTDTARTAPNKIDFQRQVQPLLRRHCYRCHGPNKAEGRLRLSSRKTVLSSDPKKGVIVPGQPEKSYLLQRLTDPGEGDVMPLDSAALPKEKIALLRRWIEEGANWPDIVAEAKHWAYTPPTRPELPRVKRMEWTSNPIDAFVLARLEAEGLTPSKPAERARLLRRVSLVLTGVPPTLAEVDRFVKDVSPHAYEKVVERLLDSKQYGERWAQHWLDLARYADSNGFQADQLRDSWAYRDWVIRALNRDMPFDQFAIEQLAGDLLPNPTADQKIATGFHRTPTCNVEAGVHPEANRVNQVFDRVNTTGTVFLGTTIECCQCHDHKYDPFTQKDYYQLFAYFNNTPLEVKKDAGVQFNFFGPKMEVPLPSAQQKQREEYQAELDELRAKQDAVRKSTGKDFQKWFAEIQQAHADRPTSWETMPIHEFASTGGEEHTILEDGSVLLGGSVPGTARYTLAYRELAEPIHGFKIETLTHKDLPGSGPGRGDVIRRNFILSEFTAKVLDSKGRTKQSVRLHSPNADFSQTKWDVGNAIDGNRKTGWAIAPQFGKPHWATFRTQNPLQLGEGETLVLELDQNYGRGRVIGRVRLSALVGDERVADLPDDLLELVTAKPQNAKAKQQLRAFFAKSNPESAKLERLAKQVQRKLDQLTPPSTLVMVEMDEPRRTHIFDRGDYLSTKDAVDVGTPATLHPLDAKLPRNRLGFAKWLVSKENPLLARVTVNRWWSEIYGRGLVSTPEDFGTQAESPSHPALLDWLAIEFMESGWSMKQMHKLMVLSSTFRQSARLTPELRARDSENVLLARGPRFRLPAETVRDNALAISGLLSEKMFGPPIMPYQPDGIWKAVGRNQPKWKTATDEDRFRRGLYIVWKRGAPYPSFVTFDAPDRAACTVQRPRTNTPLQALTLLNDPAYAEMAMALAQRMLTESGSASPEAKATHGFRLCVARTPSPREVRILTALFQKELAKLKANPKLVKERIGNLLPRLRRDDIDEVELAAWFMVANVLLNLDETISS